MHTSAHTHTHTHTQTLFLSLLCIGKREIDEGIDMQQAKAKFYQENIEQESEETLWTYLLV